MTTQSPAAGRYTLPLCFLSMAVALLVASEAVAATASSAAHLVAQYAAWAGGRDNARALVRGLTSGASVTLVTHDRRGASAAGFKPAPMSLDEASGALAQARSELSRFGIARPNAEQIQAAFVGGEVRTASGRTRLLRGVATTPDAVPAPVAVR